MIYGLSFATFLTLIIVPVMCLLSFRFKAWVKRKMGREHAPELPLAGGSVETQTVPLELN